ncbi:MAG: hypothetical protein ABI644_08080 [Arenimonas sp.]
MKVIYSLNQVAPVQSFSPSAMKPVQVVEQWKLIDPDIEISKPKPVNAEQLSRAHDENYVREILCCQRHNGFGNNSADVAASLLYTSGALLTAARLAIRENTSVAAPVSGFHHAGWNFGGGYCTFNGLMVTALDLLKHGDAKRVGILDYDYHHGNGTESILEKLDEKNIMHYTAGDEFFRPEQAGDFMHDISEHIAMMQGCDIVLYQAGADPHIDDPLGGFLSTEQLRLRDQRVFEGLKQRGIPVAWVLAGGYQKPLEKVLEIHNNTYREFMRAYSAAC